MKRQVIGMSDAVELVELIRATTTTGYHDDAPIHGHTQLWTPNGSLVVEFCDMGECDGVPEKPAGALAGNRNE
jgi:hypothetical protein